MLTAQENQKILPLTRRVAGLCYALFTLACFLPLWPLFLVGLAFKLRWQKRAKGTWLESHFEWQRGSLLVALAVFASSLAISSGMMGIFPLGNVFNVFLQPVAVVAMFLAAVWLAFRMISGWRKLHQYLPMDEKSTEARSGTGDLAAVTEAAGGFKPAMRSLNLTALVVFVLINLMLLLWVGEEQNRLTGQGDGAMGAIIGIIWLAMATGGTVVYGIFMSVAWLARDDKEQTGVASRTASNIRWGSTAVCLIMILANWLGPFVFS